MISVSERVKQYIDIETNEEEAISSMDRIAAHAQSTFLKVKQHARQIGESIVAISGMMVNVIEAFGGTLEPMQEAMINALGIALSSTIQMYTILTTGSLGALAPIAAAAIAAATYLTIAAQLATAQQMGDISSQMQAQANVMRGISQITSIWA